MSSELMIPMLPCRDLDEAVDFYEALGFVRTYRQRRPNPYAVVARGGIQVHLFGVEGFDPESSLGSFLLVVPDPDELYAEFAAGLRERFGKLPSAGIPRITRPNKKLGTVRSFSVIDPGGNWIRVSRLGDGEDDPDAVKLEGLAKATAHAARLGDAKGDSAAALTTLGKALERFADAPAGDLARALLYQCELYVRTGDIEAARAGLSRARDLASGCSDAALNEELEHVTVLIDEAT